MLEQRREAQRSGDSCWHLQRPTMSRCDWHQMCKAGKRGDIQGEVDGHGTRRVYTLAVRNHDDPEQNGVVRIPKRRVLS